MTASSLYQQGNSVGVIQSILRHKSPSTTERYLKTLGLEHTRKALEGLPVQPNVDAVEMEPRVVKKLEIKKSRLKSR